MKLTPSQVDVEGIRQILASCTKLYQQTWMAGDRGKQKSPEKMKVDTKVKMSFAILSFKREPVFFRNGSIDQPLHVKDAHNFSLLNYSQSLTREIQRSTRSHLSSDNSLYLQER
jgi:hypothetical protein